MYETNEQAPVDVLDDLLKTLAQAKERATFGRENEAKQKKVKEDLAIAERNRDKIVAITNKMTRLYKSTNDFLSKKKKESLQDLELAIAKAGELVPSSDLATAKLSIEDKKASLIYGVDQDLNIREGSAVRTIMGILMKYTAIVNQPDKLQVMLLDEAFATLDEDTTNLMRDVLEELGKVILIIGIEQHRMLFEGIVDMEYNVIKTDGVSTIRKVG